MLFLPERQNLLCSGPGQRGGGSVKEDEGGEREGNAAPRAGGSGGRARETEPESEDEVAGPSVRTKILTDLLEEQRLHNQRLLTEIAQIHGALFQMGKLIKGIILDTHDTTDHLMAKEEDGGCRAADEEVIDVDEESADGE